MRRSNVLWSTMLGMVMCLGAAGLASNVYAIREVTPTPGPDAPSQATQEAPATETPGTVGDQLQAAYDAFDQGDYQSVIDLTSAIIDQNPDTAEAYLLRGVAYSQLGNFNRAIDDYTRSIRILPYDWTSYTFRASAYSQSGKISEALDDYDKAIALNPRYAAAFTGRAQLLEAQGDTENAQIDQLIAQGLTEVDRQDYTSAISTFTQAIDASSKPDRNLANAYYNRALSYYSSGDREAAIKDYTAGIELNPEMHDLYLGRGIAYREVEETAKAGEDFAKRIEILGTDVTEETLEIGANKEVEMNYGKVYRFTFEGKAGQRLTFNASDIATVGVDPLLALLDPDGTPIAGDDDGGGTYDSEVANFELPADGTYTLVVSHANGGYAGLVSVRIVES